MDEDHTRSAWLPHSYENISSIQEGYESVVMSSHMVDQTRLPATLIYKDIFTYECIVEPACTCCATMRMAWKTVCYSAKEATMALAPGRLGDAVKMPVQVRMFPEEMATVDAFAAALSQQSYGAAFSRAEALRIAVMEWRKARQARRARVTASPPQREAAAAAEPAHADTADGAVPSPAYASFSRGLIDLQHLQPVPQHQVRPQPGLPGVLA